jgi:N-sulfoglucosamine sulfohydrolase
MVRSSKDNTDETNDFADLNRLYMEDCRVVPPRNDGCLCWRYARATLYIKQLPSRVSNLFQKKNVNSVIAKEPKRLRQSQPLEQVHDICFVRKQKNCCKHSITLALILCIGLITSTAWAQTGQIENVLLILTDDQGVDLDCYGTRGISTSATSRLARDGVLFRRAYATCASCSPARSSILTGMYPHSNGHWRNTHAPNLSAPDRDFGFDSHYRTIEKVGVHEDIPTLIEILNQAGFATGITQKFHLSPPWKYPFTHRYRANNHPNSHHAAVKAFLMASTGKPFFLMANIGNTHRPFRPHIVDIGIPPVDPNCVEVPANLPDTPLLRRDLAEYLDTVQCADVCVGAMLKALDASGRRDRTLIIFTSDQGYCYHRAKATAYDLGVHVPLIVAGPGLSREVTSEHLVSHVDLLPTILELVGLSLPDRVQGVSLQPLLTGQTVPDWRSVVFSEHNSHGPDPCEYYPIRGAFDGRFHYLRNLTPNRHWNGNPDSLLTIGFSTKQIGFAGPADAFPGGPWGNHSYEATVQAKDMFPIQYGLLRQTFMRPAEELYDHHHDPYEMQNLAEDARYQAHLGRLRKTMGMWMQETRDPGLNLRKVKRRSICKPD